MKTFLRLAVSFALIWLALGFFVAVSLGGDAILLAPGAACVSLAYAAMPEPKDDDEEESPNV